MCCEGLKQAPTIIFRSRLTFQFCWRGSMRCCDGANGFIRIAAVSRRMAYDEDV